LLKFRIFFTRPRGETGNQPDRIGKLLVNFRPKAQAFQFTIFYLPREMAALPISWGELLTIFAEFSTKSAGSAEQK